VRAPQFYPDTTGLKTLRGEDFKRDCGEKGRMTPLRRASRLWAHAGVGVVEREYLFHYR
jgi:hypothetical protein